MMQTAEQLIENFRTLPEPAREKFFELIEAEKDKEIINGSDLEQRNKKFRQALQWIEDHKEEYDGQWVILDGNAAEKFEAVFSDDYLLRQAGILEEVIEEVVEKTPGFITWQQEV